MIVVGDFYASIGLDKSLKPVADFMKSADYCVFPNKKEFDFFVDMLKHKYEECSRNLKNSRIEFKINKNGNGLIHVYQKKSSDHSVILLYVHSVKAILEYDLYAKAFFDISDRLEEGGAKWVPKIMFL